MIGQLPPHVARHDEPIPSPTIASFAGPDMRAAVPVEQMFDWLDAIADDEVAYVQLWLGLARSVGCSVAIHILRDGDAKLMMGSPVDVQARHRSRWMHLLVRHMDRIDGRREYLLQHLRQERQAIDERPRRPRETTAAIRSFLRAGGRLLIHPNGRIEEGGDMSPFLHGTDEEAETFRAANHRYFSMRHRLNADAHIRRVVRALGHRTDNGWIVLEGRA